jgi:hypothetical protein
MLKDFYAGFVFAIRTFVRFFLFQTQPFAAIRLGSTLTPSLVTYTQQ